MAQVTTLHLTGVMGPTYSFVAKNAPDPATTAYCVPRAAAFVPGAAAGGGFEIGVARGGGFEQGTAAGEGC